MVERLPVSDTESSCVIGALLLVFHTLTVQLPDATGFDTCNVYCVGEFTGNVTLHWSGTVEDDPAMSDA